MIYIEEHWETINTLSDISKIIREYYNGKLADKMDEIIESEKNDRLEELKELDELRSIIDEIKWLLP